MNERQLEQYRRSKMFAVNCNHPVYLKDTSKPAGIVDLMNRLSINERYTLNTILETGETNYNSLSQIIKIKRCELDTDIQGIYKKLDCKSIPAVMHKFFKIILEENRKLRKQILEMEDKKWLIT